MKTRTGSFILKLCMSMQQVSERQVLEAAKLKQRFNFVRVPGLCMGISAHDLF